VQGSFLFLMLPVIVAVVLSVMDPLSVIVSDSV
jgi:hypothetical protein